MTNLDAFYSGNSFSKVFNNIIIIIILLHGKYESVGKMKKIILLFSFREKKGRSGPINYSSNWCRLSLINAKNTNEALDKFMDKYKTV